MTECISEGLYRIPVPLPGNPLRELNSYLLRGRERSLLIDTGFRQEEGRRALFAGLAELDVDPRDVDVALTHLHSDHSGLAPEVVGETGWIYVSGPDRAYLEQPEEAKWAHTDAFYISEGFPPELLAQNRANPARALAPVPTGRYRTLEPGAVLEAGGRRLTCLPAPGHTPGQLCFWDESDGILFTGDHVLFDISPNITPWNGMEDALGCYLDSLRAVRELPARLALPGHRRPGALAPRVDALLEHHARRLDELTAILRARPGSTAYEAAAHMTWNIRSRSWDDFPLAQKWFAVGECIAHLTICAGRDGSSASSRTVCGMPGPFNRVRRAAAVHFPLFYLLFYSISDVLSKTDTVYFNFIYLYYYSPFFADPTSKKWRT